MITKIKKPAKSGALRVSAKHFKYGTEIRQMWIVEMAHGPHWLQMHAPEDKGDGRFETRKEANASMEKHRAALGGNK